MMKAVMRRGLAAVAMVIAALGTPPGANAAATAAATEELLACVRGPVPLARDEAIACLQRASGVRPPGPAGGASVPLAQECVVPLLDDRCEAWAQGFAHPGNTGAGGVGDRPRDLVADPLGRFVFVTGLSEDFGNVDYLTLAMRADTGEVAWSARWDGQGTDDRPWRMAVSPDGSRVFVTGTTNFATGSADQATIAYDAATGAELWAGIVSRPEDDWGVGIVVSPEGSRVYVSALSNLTGGSRDFGVITYRAATGEQAWAARGGTGRADQVAAMSVSADGRKLFLVGDTSEPTGFGIDYLTAAFDTGMPEEDEERRAHAGELLWTARWNVGSLDWPFAIETRGGRVFVSGIVEGETPQPSLVTNLDFGTAAYDAETGGQLWTSRYHSEMGGPNAAFDLAVSPDGDSVFATGQITGIASYMDLDFGTVALAAATGEQRWVGRYQVPGQMFEFGSEVGVSPNGGRVYVTGWASADAFTGSVWHGDSLTLAYEAATGAQAWAARYANQPPFTTYGLRLGVGPSGRVFTAGTLFFFASATGNPADIGVQAYDP